MLRAERHDHGLSLLETLVMAAVGILIGLVLLQTLSSVYRHTAQSSEEIGLQQMGAFTLDQIEKMVTSSAPEQMLVEENLLAVRPLEDLSTEGRQVWSDDVKVLWYDADSKKVLVGTYSLRPEERNAEKLELELADLLVGLSASRVLANDVVALNLSLTSSLSAKVTLRRGESGRDISFHRLIDIPMRTY